MTPLGLWPGVGTTTRPGAEIPCEWALVSGPAEEPITLDQAKRQARITHDDENALILSYITAGRQRAEECLGRGLLTQTWTLTLGMWADQIWLPMAAPLQNDPAATPSTAPIVQYYDATGTLQTLASTVYTVDRVSRPGRLVRAPNQVWPVLQADRWTGRVVITYVVGWTAPAQIPERILQGIRVYVGYLDSDREGLDTDGERARQAAEACWTDRVYWKPPAWVAWW